MSITPTPAPGKPERYRLILAALGDDPRPAVVRLRQALRYLLRAQRLRCVSVLPAAADGEEVQP